MKAQATDSRDNRNSAGWRVVLGSSVGVGLGSLMIVNGSFPLLSSAVMAEFGSTQTQIVRAISIYLACQMITWPVSGVLLDRIGARPVALGSIALFATSLVLSSAAHNLMQYYAAFALIGLVSAPTNFVAYARAISTWFDANRGFALGVAASAQGAGAAVVPPLTGWVMTLWGWREAVWIFAGLEMFLCFPVVALLVHERPRDERSHAQSTTFASVEEPGALPITGLTIGQVLRTWSFWALIATFALTGFSIYGIMLNLAAAAAQLAALDIRHVAAAQTLFGIAGIAGRIASGYFLDRVQGYLVAVFITMLSFVSLLLFAASNGFVLFSIAATLLGFCSGSESNFMPFFAGKLFGLKSISKVLGWFLFAFFVGAMIGPTAFAEAGSALRSYAPVLWALTATQVVIIWLYLSMRGQKGYEDNTDTVTDRCNIRIQSSQADVR